MLVVLTITDDDNDVALRIQTSGCPIETDNSGATSTSNGVCFQAGAVADIDHLYYFIGIDIGSFQQIEVDGDAADIVQVGLGNGGAVNLAFAHSALHRHSSFQMFKVQG